jgi:hypothetical protein
MFRAFLPGALRSLTRSSRAARRRAAENGTIEPQLQSKPNYSTPPRMRQAKLGDYEQIVALQNRNGLRSRPHENWLDFWLNNPVCRRRGGSWPTGWVLENSDSTIVGWHGNLPTAYYFAGRELLCATSSPWVVDKPYRGYSTLLLGHFTRQPAVDLLVNSTAGFTAGPVFNLFGYSKAPVGSWDKSAFWITNYPEFLRIILSMRGVPLAQRLRYPLGAALFVRDHFKVAYKDVGSAFPQIEECSQFDSRFDEFWERLKQERSETLLAVRTQNTLEWHFRDQLAQRQLWILTACNQSRIVAMAILDRRDRAFGLKCVRLVDFQAVRGWEKMLLSFLVRALEKCRSEGIHSMEVTGCWLDRPGLPRIVPPYYHQLPSWILYYKATNDELARALKKATVWMPSSYDGDASV